MKKSFLLLVLMNLFSATANSEEMGRITVEIIGAKDNSKPTLICFIFNSKETFLKESKALQILNASVGGNGTNCEFSVPMNKEYAIAVLQDENANRVLDKNILGVPKEGWGTSNNVTHTFKSPEFDESKILLKEKLITIKLSMRY
jgi:uncharacterized protein (DUF2141 family)